MDNDTAKIEGIIKEQLIKLDTIVNKIHNDYKNSLIDPINLEEMRKIFKVYKIYLIIFLVLFEKKQSIYRY